MPSSAVDDPIAPTILAVRQRIAAYERALHRIPKLRCVPQPLPNAGMLPRTTPRPAAANISHRSTRPFSLPRTTQQVERDSWLTDCLTMAVTLLNIALWATLFSLW